MLWWFRFACLILNDYLLNLIDSTAVITRRTPEAVCWLRLGCWSNNVANSHLDLVHSTAENCAAVLSRSAHTRLIDAAINDALRIVTGCLRPTPSNNLPILAGIQPAQLRRNGATQSLARRAMEPGHLLHSALTRPSSAKPRLFKSRYPVVPGAQQLINLSDNSMRALQWADHQWNAEWADNSTRLRIFIHDTATYPRMTLPRRAWVRLNRLRTGVGRFRSCL